MLSPVPTTMMVPFAAIAIESKNWSPAVVVFAWISPVTAFPAAS